MLTNVFWGTDTQTVDTLVTVQVCPCNLVQQLRVEFLCRAGDPNAMIHWTSALRRHVILSVPQ